MAGSSKGLDLPERGKRRIDELGDNFGSFAGTGAEDESATITGAAGRRRPMRKEEGHEIEPGIFVVHR